jgi:hypothetical protein
MLRPFKQSLEIVFFQPTPAIRIGGFLQDPVVRRPALPFGANEDRWQSCCFLIGWIVPQSASTTADHRVGASRFLSSHRSRQNENIFFDYGSSSLFIAGGNGGRRGSRRTMWVVSTSFDGWLAGYKDH